ncbi:hypothetical protein JCM10207_001861 [Rhodosporidiobolus poonsookiae]
MNPEQPFVLAMGDSSGYGYHGDFFNGWDREVLQEATNTCTDNFGMIESVRKVLDFYDSAYTCRKTSNLNEVVLGTLPKLPGCNPVTGAGANALPCSEAPPALLTGTAYEGNARPAGTKVPGNSPSVLLEYTTALGTAWAYDDCFANNVGGRALPNGLSNAPQIVEGCFEACSAKGYSLCGIEYHGECWGANTLASWSTALGASSCSLTCTGNLLQYCWFRLDHFLGCPLVFLYHFEHHHNDLEQQYHNFLALEHLDHHLDDNFCRAYPDRLDREPCADLPSFSSECWDANTIASWSTALGANQCTITCNGYQLQSCGGTGGAGKAAKASMELCRAALKAVTTSSSSSLTIATTTTTVATTTVATSSAPASSAISKTKLTSDPNWGYQGCFKDLVEGGRSLANLIQRNGWTIQSCLDAAAEASYSVAGLSYNGKCYNNVGLSPFVTALPASVCQMTCNNNWVHGCGGSGNGSLNIYYSTKNQVFTGPTNANLSTFGGWQYDNCYADNVNGQRSLAATLKNSNKTVKACLNACTAAGATVCGLSYYSECWYTTASMASSATVLPDTSCRYPCAGLATEMCGGNNTLSVWKPAAPRRRLTFRERRDAELASRKRSMRTRIY